MKQLTLAQRCPAQTRCESTVIDLTKRGNQWALTLDDSVLYPEGGGQPCDHGYIECGDQRIQVMDVQRGEDGVLHTLRTEQRPALSPGQTVGVTLDTARRTDLTIQHSAQHLLSALARQQFGLNTTSFSLPEDPSRDCEIEFDGAIDSFILDELQTQATDAIARQINIRVEHRPNGTVAQRKAAPNAPERLRVICIGDLDDNPCGGTHVRNTSELMMILLTGIGASARGSRLRFRAGRRSSLGSLQDRRTLHELGTLLSSSEQAIVPAVTQLLAHNKAHLHQIQQLQQTIQSLYAQTINGPWPAHHHFADLNPGQLAKIANAVRQRTPQAVLLLTSDSAFALAHEQAWITSNRGRLFEALDARGGGARGLLQGPCKAPHHAKRVLSWL